MKVGESRLARQDVAGAKTAFVEALEIGRAARKRAPESAVAAGDLQVSLLRLGDALKAEGSFPEAEANYEEALGIARELEAARKGSAEARRWKSVLLIRTGDLILKRGDAKTALERFLAAL